MTVIAISNIATTTGKPNALGHEYADWQRAQGVDPEALIAGKAASQKYPKQDRTRECPDR